MARRWWVRARRLAAAAVDRLGSASSPAIEPAVLDAVRCHELARAVAWALVAFEERPSERSTPCAGSVRVVDGLFAGSVEHSWIELDGPVPGKGAILDVYAVGSAPMVQLRDTGRFVVELYREGEARTDVNQDMLLTLTAAIANGFAAVIEGELELSRSVARQMRSTP